MSQSLPIPPLCSSALGALLLLTIAGVLPWFWALSVVCVTLLVHRLPGMLVADEQLPAGKRRLRQLRQRIVDPVKPHTRP
jgi:hypothetical protein